MLGRIRGDECIQQLGASDAIVAASSKKKDGTAIVSQGIDIVKSPYQSDNEHGKVRALEGLCKLGASGGSDAALRPLAESSSTKRAKGCRRLLINPNRDSDRRRWAAGGLSYLTREANGKDKLVCGDPAMRAISELSMSREQNGRYGVMATLVNLTNSYDKQETNPEMLELAKFAQHHIPEEHELDDEDFTDKRIFTICQLGATSALVVKVGFERGKFDQFNESRH